jgi:uncharacterized membrane protein YtjA (UPF0391 family)
MITLAASMFDLSGIANGAADIGETLFFAIAALVAMLVVYGLAKQRRL